jgi:hypothetical protein
MIGLAVDAAIGLQGRLQANAGAAFRMVRIWPPVGLETDLLRQWWKRSIFTRFLVPAMRLENGQIYPRFPARLATITQVRQPPSLTVSSFVYSCR